MLLLPLFLNIRSLGIVIIKAAAAFSALFSPVCACVYVFWLKFWLLLFELRVRKHTHTCYQYCFCSSYIVPQNKHSQWIEKTIFLRLSYSRCSVWLGAVCGVSVTRPGRPVHILLAKESIAWESGSMRAIMGTVEVDTATMGPALVVIAITATAWKGTATMRSVLAVIARMDTVRATPARECGCRSISGDVCSGGGGYS